MTRKTAASIVVTIIDDICDRQGLGNEWERIDSTIQAEIIEEWVTKIMAIDEKA